MTTGANMTHPKPSDAALALIKEFEQSNHFAPTIYRCPAEAKRRRLRYGFQAHRFFSFFKPLRFFFSILPSGFARLSQTIAVGIAHGQRIAPCPTGRSHERFLDNLLKTPSQANSFLNSLGWNLQRLSPFGNRPSLSVVFDKFIGARIVGLNFLCCPSAIPRSIRPFVVDAINRMVRRWPWPHVCKKLLKGGVPFWTNLDSAPAISLIHIIFYVIASLSHAAPNRKFWGISSTMRFSINRGYFTHPASARNCSTITYGIKGDGFFIPAITLANNFSVTPFAIFRITNYCQTPISFSNNVFSLFSHDSL